MHYSGHQYPSHTGNGVKSYHLQMRTVKDVNTSVKLSGAQCSSSEGAYIALPQRLNICQQKLHSHLTFSVFAEASIEQLLCSFYRSRKFYCLVDPASANIALSSWNRAGEFTIVMLGWDVRALP